MKLFITREMELTQEMFENVIIGALEGGSNYWYELNVDEFRLSLPSKSELHSALTERISNALYTNPKFQMKVYDRENSDEVLGIVNQASMLKAFELANLHYSTHVDNIISDDYDVEDADIMFQFATMGEIIFG